MNDRKVLLGELWKSASDHRKQLGDAISRANKATNRAVIVKPIASPDRSFFIGVVNNHISKSRKALIELIERDDFSPQDFVSAVRSGGVGFEKMTGRKGAQWTSIHSAGEKFLREIEEHVVGYAVEVSLDVSPEGGTRQYRTLGSLSKGQRATALLLLLLGAADSPLIIDQPEDDLDNRFVYGGVVEKLRNLKGQRQIIVSTHNANVPVLGDAELIVALEGDGTNGWPMKDRTGSLDDEKIRQIAEDLLEGGHTAFDTRRHLYGF